MIDMLSRLLGSTKFGVAFFGIVLALVMKYLGFDTLTILAIAIAPTSAFVIGQGLTGKGADAARIAADTQQKALEFQAAIEAAKNPQVKEELKTQGLV